MVERCPGLVLQRMGAFDAGKLQRLPIDLGQKVCGKDGRIAAREGVVKFVAVNCLNTDVAALAPLALGFAATLCAAMKAAPSAPT